MPGVDMGKTYNANELDLRGTPLVKLVLDIDDKGSVHGRYSTHLAVINTTKPLCGAKGKPSQESPGQRICESCRVAAASPELGKLGGVIR